MKLILSDLTSLTNESSAITAINANGTLIETALENTLSLDGTIPNHMSANLDLNGNRILNLPDALTEQEPVTLGQLEDLIDTTALAPINASYLTLGTNSSLTRERVLTAGTGVSFTDGGVGSTLTINNTAVPASAALTRTNDTNVTLTLGGTPTTALLQATSMTLGWTGTLGASRGGFGADVSASSGVPLFATGTPTFTSTTGTGNIARAAGPSFTGTITLNTTPILVIGHTASITSATVVRQLQLHGTAATGTQVARWSADSIGPSYTLFKSRGASIGTNTIVQTDDSLGQIVWYGDGGTSTSGVDCASIRAEVDGTPGTTFMPGRLIFCTAQDGIGAFTVDRLILDKVGCLKPSSNDGVALGTGLLAYSDLFLASGAVVNFNNGSVTLTHSSGTLTVSGGKVATAASSTTRAGLSIPSGAAPSSPVSGDLWYDGTNLKFRDGVTTRTLTWT